MSAAANVTTLPAAHSLTAEDIRQAGLLFEQLAEMAGVLAGLAVELVDTCDVGAGATEAVAVRYLANQAGWVADLGCKKLSGQFTVRGGAEKWMLAPIYHAGEADHE